MFFNKKEEIDDIDSKIISNIKALNIDLINVKHNGNYELSLGLAKALYVLYSKHLKINTNNFNWLNRDRVVLSSNGAYSILSSIYYMLGYDVIKNTDLPGIDLIANIPGEALANGVGVAIGENYLNKTFKQGNNSVFDFNTYVICNDLDLMKGLTFESLSLAGTLKLGKLIILYDDYKKVLNCDTNFTLDCRYFESLGLNYIIVDKNNIIEIDGAIAKAKTSDRPTVIILHGSNKTFENNYVDTNYQLTEEEISNLKKELDVRDIPFTVSSEAALKMQEIVNERNNHAINSWNKLYENLDDNQKLQLEKWDNNNQSLNNTKIDYDGDLESEIVDCTFKVLNSLSVDNPYFLGLTSEYADKLPLFENKIITCGLRENISSIQNGLSLVGIRNFSISNLKLVEKEIPSIKLAVLNNLANIYILFEDKQTFTNNMVKLPKTEISNLRSIPNLEVYRPNDANEMIGTFNLITSKSKSVSSIILGRGVTSVKENSSITDVKKGAYIIKKEDKNVGAVIISSGVDLDIALDVANKLQEKGYDIRVVSMPCMELFKNQTDKYREEILPFGTKVFVIENTSSYSWNEFVYNDKYLITSDKIEWFTNEEEKEVFEATVLEKIENLLK